LAGLCNGGNSPARLKASATKARVKVVALDFSPTMPAELDKLFGKDPGVTSVAHDFDQPFPPLRPFDAMISSFAIHHVLHAEALQMSQGA